MGQLIEVTDLTNATMYTVASLGATTISVSAPTNPLSRTYAPGSLGPEASDALLARDGLKWHEPGAGAHK